jgi:molybdate transport system ATP-binding protein
VLVLDDATSAVDATKEHEIRAALAEVMRGRTTLVIAHRPATVALADRVAVLEDGRITQEGVGEELLRHPRSPYVAELMGLNLLRGRVVSREHGMARVETAAGEAVTVVDPEVGGGEVFLAIDPREVTLHRVAPAGSAQNLLRGTIREIVPEPPLGERLRVVLDSRPPIVAEVTTAAVAGMRLEPGLEVVAAFKATGVTTYS